MNKSKLILISLSLTFIFSACSTVSETEKHFQTTIKNRHAMIVALSQ